MKETDIQIGIVDWIKSHEDDYEVLKCIYHIPNSFFGTGFGVIKWLQKLGLKKGVFDLCIPIDNGVYPFCYIEIKSAKGKLSEEQRRFKDIVMRNSNKMPLFVEIRSIDEGILFIKRYLGIEEECID